LNIVFFGTPLFAVPALKALVDSEHTVTAVVTQPDKQSGRGRTVKECPVKTEAIRRGLSVLQPARVRDADFIDKLKTLAPDVIVVVAYGQILPAAILDLPEYGCVNIHASLLPEYRGSAPINRAIIDGKKITGVTTMLLPELCQKGCRIQGAIFC
jgi:methionyl-tRNA formyltransferase